MALAAAVWTRCTGVNPASTYWRWRTRDGLLADVAMSRLERDLRSRTPAACAAT
jgi:AcrR family transcriptional regulator